MVVISFLIVFGIIVLAHEFGHFIAARLVKIRVEVFSFGFGKRVFGKKYGNTDFRVSLIPFGGYVRLAGEEDFESSQRRPDDLYAKNRGQRFFTFIMGSVMNLCLAVFIIAVINMTGVEIESYKLEKPEIGFVEKNSPAQKADLQAGDLILAINGKQVSNWKELDMLIGTNPKENLRIDLQRNGKKLQTLLNVATRGKIELGYAGFYAKQKIEVVEVFNGFPGQKAGLRQGDIILSVNGTDYFNLPEVIQRSPEKKLVFTIKRDEKKIDLEVIPQKNDKGEGVIGFKFTSVFSKTRFGFFASFSRSIQESVRLVSLTFEAFKKMARGKLSLNQFSSVIDIADYSHQALSSGLSNFFMLIAFISLQLGIINLFPIPGLDGGHLMILGIESVIRRDLNQRLKNTLIYIGFSLLMALMTFAILNDIRKRLPNGWKSIFPFF